MEDLLIDKPPCVRDYDLHRVVAQLCNGRGDLWADEGTRLRVRPRDAQPPRHEAGKLLVFTTLACVALRRGNRRRHRYLELSDWRGRHDWLHRQGLTHGFELVGVHAHAGVRRIHDHGQRQFTLDATRFNGVLRVTDPEAFGRCLVHGIGRVGKAFGLNLLIID